MIAIVSSLARERAALVALCESRGWAALGCDSARALDRELRRQAARVVVARHKLNDGYSDDVLARLRTDDRGSETKVIVLMAADTSSSIEARQLALGADCVLRDPVRIDVLLAYLEKYKHPATRAARGRDATLPATLTFAGATVCPALRTLTVADRSVQLTPHELALVELLAQSEGVPVTYDSLYSEILGRPFRGDTSNMRVLFGRLARTAGKLGLPLRDCIKVIPKTGYCYCSPRVPGVAA